MRGLVRRWETSGEGSGRPASNAKTARKVLGEKMKGLKTAPGGSVSFLVKVSGMNGSEYLKGLKTFRVFIEGTEIKGQQTTWEAVCNLFFRTKPILNAYVCVCECECDMCVCMCVCT